MSDSIKLLGLELDSCLTFEKHVDDAAHKMMGYLRMISGQRYKLSRATKVWLLNAYVTSNLTYSLPVIGHKKNTLDVYQKLQNFAVRIIYGLDRFSSVQLLRKRLGWAKIENLYKYRLAIKVYQAVHATGPIYLSLNLQDRLPSKHYNLRQEILRQDSASSNDFLKFGFTHKGIEMFNQLGGAIFAGNFGEFKDAVKKIFD